MSEDELAIVFNRAHNYIKENYKLLNLNIGNEDDIAFMDGAELRDVDKKCYYIRSFYSDILFEIPKTSIYNIRPVNFYINKSYVLVNKDYIDNIWEFVENYDLAFQPLIMEFDSYDRYGEQYVN